MDVKIIPNKIYGKIDAIASKSFAHRILIASALCKEKTSISLNYVSKDIEATINAIKSMGAKVENNNNIYTVYPIQKADKVNVFCNESGTTARIILPLLCSLYENASLTGSGSLNKRPFTDLVNCLKNNGVEIDNDFLPINTKGKLSSGQYNICGNVSSQYISGLMFALPLLNGDSTINLTTPLESKAYIEITLSVLNMFGISSGYKIKGKQMFVSPKNIKVEGDWSNSAFWLCAGIKVNGLNKDSVQGDKVFDAVKDNMEIDASEIPDLVPILAVYATQKKVPTKIYNMQRLKIKESNRIKSVYEMIKNLGGNIELINDEYFITPSKLSGGLVNSYNDHRIVMAATIASCYCENQVVIKDANAVEKSYPQFFEHFGFLGGKYYVV